MTIEKQFPKLPEVADHLKEYFPEVDPGQFPCGSRVLIQIRRPKTKTTGGIILTSSDRDTEKFNTMVGRVLVLGPLAYRNRDTGLPWTEGEWVQPGDYVRIPKWGGDRVNMTPKDGSEEVTLVTLNDHEVISVITSDPNVFYDFVK
jgi:co-chaperonin GroES (HSP10)